MASQKRPQTHRNRRPILRLGLTACRRTPAVDTVGIVRRALCATLRLPRAQNAHATSVVDITAMPYVAPLARHQISSRAQNAHAALPFQLARRRLDMRADKPLELF
ncbi:MAG: hypothetical protein AWU56_1849 [Idiomarina sp. T82-3]|jgi:hypothetical protein|nr:MAG: hypothetical protein AWU56_1849 [Idiomarina sp. T82-3]